MRLLSAIRSVFHPPRGWPVPVRRPDGFNVHDEAWPEPVHEPMTHRRAEDVLLRRRNLSASTAPRAVSPPRPSKVEMGVRMAEQASQLEEILLSMHGNRRYTQNTRGMVRLVWYGPGGPCDIDEFTQTCRTHHTTEMGCLLGNQSLHWNM